MTRQSLALILGAAVAAVALAWSDAADARQFMTAEFKEGKTVGTVAILPPQAEMLMRKVGADDSMIAESRRLEDYGLANLVSAFEEKQYLVTVLSADDIAGDSELQGLVRRANERFEEVYAKVARRPGQVKRGRYTLGEDAQALADYLNVDAIVFERIVMEVAAPGQMAMGLLIGGSTGGSILAVTVVNGDDGAVLGYYDHILGLIGRDKAATEAEKMVTNMSNTALKRLPEGSGEARMADDAADDEAVLSELEGLLGEEEETPEAGASEATDMAGPMSGAAEEAETEVVIETEAEAL